MRTKSLTRPEWEITPERISKLKQYAFDGMNKSQIADCLGIHINTLIDKLKVSEEFKEAYEQGRSEGLAAEANEIRAVKASLFKNAKDHEVVTKDGDAIEVPGDVKAQTFIMKARAGWQDTKPAETQINIVIPPLFAPHHMQDLEAMLKGPSDTIDA